MKYQFEPASHISDYLAAIKDRSEFVVVEKDGGYTVINYLVQMADTFPDPETASSPEERRNFILRRECRGIIFSTATGHVIAKRLHKFFNVNEREETQVGKVDFSEPHVILEKLDGSMITPVWTTLGLRWGTKMGVTMVALPVEEFVAEHPEYVDLAELCRDNRLTPIFEWTSRKQTIVIDYPTDNLVLIAIRNNVTGEYLPYDE
jgi:RNA ligase